MQAIGLGKDCAIASTLVDLGVMRVESVFDDKFTMNLDRLNDLLEESGEPFQPENIVWKGKLFDYINCKEFWKVWDKKYQILSLHSVPYTTNMALAMEHLKRIESAKDRIHHQIKNATHPHIIRNNAAGTKLEQCIRLYDAINKIRENRPFRLSIIQNVRFAEKDWGLRGLKMYRVKSPKWLVQEKRWDFAPDWHLAFKSILSTFFVKL